MIRFAVQNASTPPTHNPCTASATLVLLEDLGQRQRSDENALDLIQADGVVGAIVELGRARGFVVSGLLCTLYCTAILQVGGNARSPDLNYYLTVL